MHNPELKIMVMITGNVDIADLPKNAILVNFDIVNMFSSIKSMSSLDAVKSVKSLFNRSTNMPPNECLLVGLEFCLTCNNGNFLQTDGAAQEPHMSCSCSDICNVQVLCCCFRILSSVNTLEKISR